MAAPTCRRCARLPRRDGDDYVVNGSKTWITQRAPVGSDRAAVQDRPDADARAHGHQRSCWSSRARASTVSRDLPKLGYKGVESCELTFDDFRVPAGSLLGGARGQGFAQMMRGLETGRIQVAARAVGVGQAALEDALRYAQDRESVRQADLEAPVDRQLPRGHGDQADGGPPAHAATPPSAYDAGGRADMEAGMAKLFASEVAMQIALNAVRIHGGYGYSTEFDVERYFRDAPLMIVGEGTNEIQRNVIASQLVARGGI